MRIRDVKRIVNYRFFPSVAGPTYEPETPAYRDRVLADGGEVIDLDYVDSVYKKLKELSLLSSLKHWTSARAGVRKDSAGYISKVYSLDGVNDGVQTTGAAQPLYSSTGYVFDGTDDGLAAAYHSSLNVPNITLKAKVNFSSLTGYREMISRERPFSFRTHESTVQFAVNNGAWHIIGGGTVALNTDYDIMATYDGGIMQLSVNGQVVAEKALTGDMVATTVPLGIGYLGTSNLYNFGGKMKEAQMFSKALTAEQNTALNAL